MTVIESNEEVDFAPEEIIDPIEVICTGTCESLSGRSDLTFVIGRHTDVGTLSMAIAANSGGGMFCKDWVSASAIQDVVLGECGLTAKSFHVLTPGKSINTGGFIASSLRALGLIRANEENTRLHEHVPGATFDKVASAYMAHAKAAKGVKPVVVDAGGRKTLKLKGG